MLLTMRTRWLKSTETLFTVCTRRWCPCTYQDVKFSVRNWRSWICQHMHNFSCALSCHRFTVNSVGYTLLVWWCQTYGLGNFCKFGFSSFISGSIRVVTAHRLFVGDYFVWLSNWVQKIIRTWLYIIPTSENVDAVQMTTSRGKLRHQDWSTPVHTELFPVHPVGFPVQIFSGTALSAT